MTKRIRNIFAAVTVALLCTTVVAAFGFSAVYADGGNYTGLVYRWSGDLSAAGWGGNGVLPTYENGTPTYELVKDESDALKTVNIHDASALAYFAHEASLPANNGFEGVTVNLMCDIDLGGDSNIWLPIGLDSRKHSTADGGISFKGVFDGNGHTIYNFSAEKFLANVHRSGENFYVQASDGLTVTYPAGLDTGTTYEYVYGLFGNVGNAVIKNLNIKDVKLDLPAKKVVADSSTDEFTFVTDCVGAVAGYAAGDLTLQNITVGEADRENYIKHSLSTGGLVGRVYAGKKNGAPLGSPAGNDNGTLAEGVTLGAVTVTNCVNYIDLGTPEIGDKNNGITGDKRAGLLGYVHGVSEFTIRDCVNYGDVIAAYAGGAVSYLRPNDKWHRASDGEALTFEYNVQNFKNYGTIRGKFGDVGYNKNATPVYRSSESMWVGGVFGKLEDMVDDVTGSTFKGSKTVNITNCVNYGTITCEDADFHDKSPENESVFITNSHYIGGIVGYLRNNKNTTVTFADNFNYGDIKAYNGDIQLETKDNLYAAGLIGAVNFKSAEDAQKSKLSGANVGSIVGKGKLAGCVGNYPSGKLDSWTTDYLINAYKLTETSGTATVPPIAELPEAELVYLDNTHTVVTGINKTADGFDIEKKFAVAIPDTVTEISAGAFAGLENLAAVSFGNYSKLEKIGDFAFGGTGVVSVALPASLKTIGNGAFSDCALLASVTLPSELETVGDGAFGNLANSATFNIGNIDAEYGAFVFDAGSYIVVENRKAYLAAEQTSLGAYYDDVTYTVAIEYDYLGATIAVEDKLFGKDYGVTLQNGAWTATSDATLGTALTKSMVWYADAAGSGNALTAETVSDMLKADNAETIRIYAFDKGEGRVFFARNDIVYDGRSYGMTELNPLLYSTSDKITARMTVTIESYADADGNVVAKNNEKFPKAVCDAGKYGMKVVEDGSEYEFDINIARATVDLGDYTEVLSWKLTNVGSVNVNSELRNESGLTLYIYTDKDGKEYPAIAPLSDSEIDELGLDENYETRFVRYSVVRYRGSTVGIGIAGGMAGKAFSVPRDGYDNEGGKTEQGCDIGTYTACAKIVAENNYVLAMGTAPVDGAARGITIEVAADGRSAIVTKVWYIVEVGNYTVMPDGGEYKIENRTFGDTAVTDVPRLMYGDVQPSDYGSAADPVTLSLTLNGNSVGNPTFTRDRFMQYVNNVMPAGEYRLHISVRSVVSSEVDGDGGVQNIPHSEFDETVTFTVEKQEMPVLIADRIEKLINGVEFKYVYDGAAHYYYDDARIEIDTALASVATADRNGTVWSASRYDEFYGDFGIVFNLSRMQNDEYYAASAMPVQTSAPDRYTVFYKIAAPNYYDSVEGKTRTDSYFEVVNVMEIALPVLSDVRYDGNVQKADITDNLVYTVTQNVGGVNVGSYDVELTFRQPEFYMWAGQTLENMTASTTVKFNVTASSNRWSVEPTVKFWVEGKFDANENAVSGKPLFGTAVIIITDSKDNVVFDSSKNINDLDILKAGTYRLSATVTGTADYDGLSYSMFVNVFEKPGLPWWGILLIVIGALLVAAIIILVLWKKGVFQILTGKLVLAIRTKATIDATIASVRASKIAEQSRASRAEAEAKDKAAERAQARREAMEAERAKSNDEKAAELEAKAQAEVERANQILAKATAMQERAAAMKAPAEEAKAESEEAPKKSKKSKKSEKAEEPAKSDDAEKAEGPVKPDDAVPEAPAEEAETEAEEAAATSDSDVQPPTED